MALGVMKAAKDKGLKIPKNLSLVGFDDYESGAHLSPPLTAVRQPIYELGKEAGKKILGQWKNLENAGMEVEIMQLIKVFRFLEKQNYLHYILLPPLVSMPKI